MIFAPPKKYIFQARAIMFVDGVKAFQVPAMFKNLDGEDRQAQIKTG